MSASTLLRKLAANAAGRTVVVLDDDPTGTQTVRDVPVLTAWTPDELTALLADRPPIAFLLTNSRSLPVDRARRLARQAGETLVDASTAAGRPISMVSRSDSTLRGHFPAEVDSLAEGLGWTDPTVLLAPYFGEGGRITVGNTHFLRRDGSLLPVAETEFARDPDFGYSTSHLPSWVAERAGRNRAVGVLGLELIREGIAGVASALRSAPGRVWVVNAEVDADLEVVAVAAAGLEDEGQAILARTAASYPRIRAGQHPAVPLRPGDLALGSGPGMIVVGSHVGLTTRQLERLRAEAAVPLEWIELSAREALGDGAAQAVERTATAATRALAGGRTPVVLTSRERAAGISLDAGLAVARALSGVVTGVTRRPAWIIGKGGITSSVVATDGLGVRRATVLGPLLPGVPTWRCGAESRWPDMTLVVFPGNVGGEDALLDAVAALRR